MFGLMQDRPLLISSLVTHAALNHGRREIISRTLSGDIHRSSYGEVIRRAGQLAHAMARLGISPGDVVGSLAWNGYRHLEIYYSISSMGAVLNTINPRLFEEQLTYIINHAENKYLFVDLSFVKMLENIRDQIPAVKGFILLASADEMPDTSLPDAICYEELIAGEPESYDWPEFDENTAAVLCYTSGTTGDPKGVLYSHRSTILHTFSLTQQEVFDIGGRDSILPVVPMFHVSAWGLPYAGAMTGAKLVFPGDDAGGENILNLIESEGCTKVLGVPTVWLGLLDHVKSLPSRDYTGLPLKHFLIGGSAVPRSMLEELERSFGATVLQVWGMTEMSPIGTVAHLLPEHEGLSDDEKMARKLTQGRVAFGIDIKIIDEDGQELPRDGESFGRLMVRGPWITKGYFRRDDVTVLDEDGWFDTGDVSTIDPDGYMTIVDRSKDVIKSGGEWISSIDLENAAVGHPDISEAAVIGLPHSKWQERPLLICVAVPGKSPTRQEVLDYLSDRIVKWWMPDEVEFIDEMPHTATGKIQKMQLRAMFRGRTLG
ncbi:long-chain fatty acid--CoA ligase [Emcibacter nanhaiensis]|uniref:3-methylmercaptopropionyl-CoA ligase n=1 Tax=Emcibacter nanhaiensis TaxID=1505037 RepID=A0A501PEU6_9PROT|nr:long-chain fatty acid--CoA ligase [Emcibacter nanhaiensis]TPD58950.1 long-chain fatty acid--CoA ligase [Emcibacter nanhaiensis]